tara:strand:+ start:1763 stop:1909 length:147 start_codon:yes stop_codon:yes gene_type:complete
MLAYVGEKYALPFTKGRLTILPNAAPSCSSKKIFQQENMSSAAKTDLS